MGVYLYKNNTENELSNAYIGIPNPESITLDKSSISLTTVGQTEQLTATIEPTISDHSITWTTSDSTVATVSTTGLVTCVTPGTATITATTVNGLTATCSVSEGWSPGVNTVAYYPLTSSSTVNDESGNSYTLTNAGNVTFGTNYGVNCAYFNGTQNGMLVQNNISFNAYPTYTASVRMYVTTNSEYNTIYVIGSVMETGALGSWYRRNTGLSLSGWSPSGEVIKYGNIDGGWHLLTNVVNGSSSIQYLDGQQYQTLTNHLSGTQTVLSLGVPANFHQENVLTGSLSNFILEDKVRTAQDVADYYDLTKANYGIS